MEQILKYRPDFDITIFGDETHVNYNRILLSSVLAGEKSADEILLNDVAWYQDHGIRARLGVRIDHVDRSRRVAIDSDGGVTPYDKLILATGSSAFIPSIPGVDKKNVHVFRTLDDTRELIAKARTGCKAVVIGGGLLGLEAARGLQLRGCEVSVVHLVETLMERQLDSDRRRAIYAARSKASAYAYCFPGKPKPDLATAKWTGFRFASGEEIEADLVVIAAGIKPNVQLGRKAGLEVRRGIVVNDYMETSDPDIFAVGECTEHRGQTFGLVAPLMEQGKVLAATITGNPLAASLALRPPRS